MRITDGALVAAATLSTATSPDRFLPDKAIDLIDEAASRLRIEIDSMPTEVDEVERQLTQLQIEEQALAHEKDDASARAGLRLRDGAGGGSPRSSSGSKATWQYEKAVIEGGDCRQDRAGRGAYRAGAAERAADFDRAAEIKFGRLPELQRKVDEQQRRLAELQASGAMLKEEVTQEEIAEVVSKWTGIPVARLMEGEVEKLLHMEERLAKRVVGQDEAVAAVQPRCAFGAPGCRTPTGRSARSCSSGRPAWARPSSPRRSPSSCSTTSARWCASTCPSTWRSTACRGSSARLPATSATRRAASSPKPFGAGPTR